MNTIGILGGMGPLATCDLYAKIIALTDASRDQEHPKVLIYGNTSVPNRTEAITGAGESPLPELLRSARLLERMGAGLIAMPCNTSHYYYDELAASVSVPFLNMPVLTRDACLGRGVKRAALLATEGAYSGQVFERAFEGSGIELLLPENRERHAVMDMIYCGVKASDSGYDPAPFAAVVRRLLNDGAETVILGCTELPPAFALFGVEAPTVDPTLELARAAVVLAGAKLRE